MEANIFHSHPIIGLITSLFAIGIAEFLKVLDHHVPVLIMDLFQIAAWGAAILVGLISAHGWWKKNCNKNANG